MGIADWVLKSLTTFVCGIAVYGIYIATVHPSYLTVGFAALDVFLASSCVYSDYRRFSR